MSDLVLSSDASLFREPISSSLLVAAVRAGTFAALSNRLGNWSRVSIIDPSSQTLVGWIESHFLTEVTSVSFVLYDAPFGTVTIVEGRVIDEKETLEAWKKVAITKSDGAVVEGWIDTGNASNLVTSDLAGAEKGAAEVKATTSLLLGANDGYRAYILKASDRTSIDPAALAALIDAEAGKKSGAWDPNSRATGSSASGLTQFLDSTWIGEACRTGTYLNQTAKIKNYISGDSKIIAGCEVALLQLRFDPELSIIAAAEFGKANLKGLEQEGLIADEIGDDDRARFMYLAHHEGLAGAKAYLRGTAQYTFASLKIQVGAQRAQALTDAAGGDTTKAYRNWFDGYLDQKIQPSKFRSAVAPSIGSPVSAGPLMGFSGPPIPIDELSNRKDLAKAIQWRLHDLGYLDPPADGVFGPVSIWALDDFCLRNALELGNIFTKDVAKLLVAPKKNLPKIIAGKNWFDKVITYMEMKNYFISKHPDCFNIIYLEGANTDGALNSDLPNMFNDVRILFKIGNDGRPVFDEWIWEATTEPGKYWTENPMNPKGAARIAFDQYKAWRGWHTSCRHDASARSIGADSSSDRVS